MMETIVAYKLFRVRKDGTIGPLFINRKLVVAPPLVNGWRQSATQRKVSPYGPAGTAHWPLWPLTLAPT